MIYTKLLTIFFVLIYEHISGPLIMKSISDSTCFLAPPSAQAFELKRMYRGRCNENLLKFIDNINGHMDSISFGDAMAFPVVPRSGQTFCLRVSVS